MDVAGVVGTSLATHGVDHVFGLVGSGNFHVTNALVAAGARFVAATHEGGAACMADGYARVSGRLTALSVHQGPGLTNAMTGIAEAAKSRTPMIVLAPEATNPRSNFFIDLEGIAAAVGAAFRRVRAERAAADVTDACRTAIDGAGSTVMLALPLGVLSMPAGDADAATTSPAAAEAPPVNAADVKPLIDAVVAARRPVFIAGRGATRHADAARAALSELADRCGALLAVSAAAKGLFAGHPWYLDVSGGFASPLAATLIAQADLVVAWGSTLNMWTTRHGRLISPEAVVAQVDLNPSALGVSRAIDVGVAGDVAAVARACVREWERRGAAPARWRTDELRQKIAAEIAWRSVPYVDTSDDERIDPRTFSIALDHALPQERTVVIDSGNFMGYPSMFLSVPDVEGFCFTQAFQSVGLGLSSAIGAALARPDRLTVAALGDGGFLMSVAELTTAVRLRLPLLIVVYNDSAFGAEVHHFGPQGHRLDTVTFPPTDLAAIARGFGCAATTVRGSGDVGAIRGWLDDSDGRPLVVDAKVVATRGSWWLEEAFRGH
jgi:thiamine pyrophosphate-dependent acetolactate synthase large subunit-like protein